MQTLKNATLQLSKNLSLTNDTLNHIITLCTQKYATKEAKTNEALFNTIETQSITSHNWHQDTISLETKYTKEALLNILNQLKPWR